MYLSSIKYQPACLFRVVREFKTVESLRSTVGSYTYQLGGLCLGGPLFSANCDIQ